MFIQFILFFIYSIIIFLCVQIIQDDFVKMRSENKNIDADNLHALMVFARLMSLSYGQTTLNADCWKKTVHLEMERMSRLPQRNR